jgi:nucleoid-associated protein YgaU
MALRKRSGSAFWIFLVLLALGAGWAANQDWRWPLALFDHEGEADGQASAPEGLAEEPAGQSVTEQPVAEQPAAEQVVVEESTPEATVAEPAATQPADAGAEPMPAATDPAGPTGRDLAAESPASEQSQPAVRETPDPASERTEAEVAAPQADPEPSATEVAASETDPEPATPEARAAVSEPLRGSPEQEQADDDASSPASTGGDVGTSVASTGDPPPRPDAQTAAETETEAGPRFDIVRVGRDGRAVIAGRAAPGAEVEVRSGGQVIDRVQATRRGEWVAIPARPLAPGDQELSAVASQGGAAVESEQVVVVAVPGPSSPTSPVMASAAAETTDPAQPVAVLLPRDGRGTGRILQAPGRLSAEGTLALMTVSYDESGEVLLSGEAPPGVPVRIYVDNRPAALVVGDAKGGWSSGLGETLAPGTYTLRLDQLDADGETVARIETPFTRVSEPPVEGDLKVDFVVVQPGNSLWRIARRLSGKGLDYVHIYGVNQTQIRDPDLIYPGQVFEIPAEFDSAG